MEAIIGVQVKSKSTPLQRDYSCRKLKIRYFYILHKNKKKKPNPNKQHYKNQLLLFDLLLFV